MPAEKASKDVRTMDADAMPDEWTVWADVGEADWWLKHPLHRPPHYRGLKQCHKF